MQLTPLIAVHMTAAFIAIAVGPVALWSRLWVRKGTTQLPQRPKLHRAFGYAWVTMMLVASISAIFIRDYRLPNIAGYTPIHLLVPITLYTLFRAFRSLAQGNIAGHRKAMQSLYIGACVVAGAFTLLPGRYLGNLVFGQWLGLIAPDSQSPRANPMIGQILINTPVWVWGLLVALLVLGLSQTRDRTLGLRRIVLLPIGMSALSLYSTLSTFGMSPTVLGCWLATSVVLMLLVTQLPVPTGASYDSKARRFRLAGSWIPIALILGIFLTKYAVGVSVAMHPELKLQANFSLAIVMLYGAFSGIFVGRALRLIHLVRLAQRPTAGRVRPAFNL